MASQNHRYVVLDGLRGVAALVVLLCHVTQSLWRDALPFAGYAVDFFFMLSGFVVAAAYEKRLQDGLTPLAFMKIRLIRLYPLIFVGVSMGVALAVLASVVKGSPALDDVARAAVLAYLLLPSYVFPQWDTAYPFNMAAWSLFFELAVNLVFALTVAWLGTRRLIALVALAAVALAISAIPGGGVGGGNDQGNFLQGFVRVIFPFFAGVLLYRFRPRIQTTTPGLGWLLMGLLFACLCWPFYNGAATSIAFIVVAWPLVVWLGAATPGEGFLAKFSRLAGRLSFPVYILQSPILRLSSEIQGRLHLAGGQRLAFMGFAIAVCILTGYLAVRFIDEPLQKMLAQRRRASAPAALA